MKRPDPRILRAEKLLAEIGRMLAEIREGVPAPRPPPKRRRQYKLPSILAALREGASLDARGEARDPRLPSRNVLAKYRKTNRAFDREARELLKERGRIASRRKGRIAPNPGATVAAQRMPGQKYDWNAIAAKIEAGATVGPYSPNRHDLPSHTLIIARRKADPVFARRVTPALAKRFGLGRRILIDRPAVLELIRRGAVIKASPPEPGMPRKDLIDRERHEDPQFDADVRAAIAEARRRRKNRHRLSKLSRNAAWTLADKVVPRSIDPDLRGDVIGELALALCSGEVGVSDDLQVAWKRFRTQLTRSRWKESSLDAVIAGTESLRRIDLLSSDTEHF
ncbi:MAG TPA: hypothetical protein VIP08_10755 [Phenylobacterium sp.]|uniref:hypothetical protein n=1 Tax=Phenylobacterium sp. TaxID=1871053 RepID=UPI002F935A55